MSKLLIFPCSAEQNSFYQFCRTINKSVIAATSEKSHLFHNYFDEVVRLPYIYQENFTEELIHLIEDRKIDTIFSPITSVHAFLNKLIRNENISVNLIAESPIKSQESFYNDLFCRSDDALTFIKTIAPENQFSLLNIAAILRQSTLIYGESNDIKIQAMIAIFSSASRGDVIEIGSLMGRTAFVLSYLSKHYHIGPVLAVDPWSESAAIQKDSPDMFQTILPKAWDCELLSKAFVINMLSVNRENFNYLRMTSENAYNYYHEHETVSSDAFGTTHYSRKISVIHIDGNHDYDAVKQDCELWLSKLTANAWVIIDDYIWVHGDGPKRIGDEFLSHHQETIKRSFVCGKALFIQLG